MKQFKGKSAGYTPYLVIKNMVSGRFSNRSIEWNKQLLLVIILIMVYYGLLWFIMVYYGLLWFIMVYYGLLSHYPIIILWLSRSHPMIIPFLSCYYRIALL